AHPAALRRAVLGGMPEDTKAQVHEVDGRRAAIELAASLADVSDTILVAGKGAETGQQIGDIVHPFDDRLRLRTALSGTGTKCADDTDGER
ncbi:UDP-N-acetylmuramoyl-L-alanyl-D-glutamate--2,6-diaminopimelate ligase, partial [Brachybacterium tyrofermentans]